jgi:hypothetical protein
MHRSNSNLRQGGTLDTEDINDVNDHFTFSDKAVQGREQRLRHENGSSITAEDQYIAFNPTPELGAGNNQAGATDLEAGLGSKVRSNEPLTVLAVPHRNLDDQNLFNDQSPTSDVSDPPRNVVE